MPDGVELNRLGTKLEFEDDDNRRETTLDLGALVAAEAPDLLRDKSACAKDKMRADGNLAGFFVLAGFEFKTYRGSAFIQLVLFSVSFSFDILIYVGKGEPEMWSTAFIVAFACNCTFLLDSLFRFLLGSSPFAWMIVLSAGTLYAEPQYLPVSLQRYQATLFGGCCAVTLILRFFTESEALIVVSAYLWLSLFVFAVLGLCPVFLIYGLLLKKEIITLSTRTRNFLINQSQVICRFSPYFVNVYVETQDAPDSPRPW